MNYLVICEDILDQVPLEPLCCFVPISPDNRYIKHAQLSTACGNLLTKLKLEQDKLTIHLAVLWELFGLTLSYMVSTSPWVTNLIQRSMAL